MTVKPVLSCLEGRTLTELSKSEKETEEYLKRSVASQILHILSLFQIEPLRVGEILDEVKSQYQKPKDPCANCEHRERKSDGH
jgi:hypothetical protein